MNDDVKFTPKASLEENHNVSTKKPLVDFFQLSLSLSAFFVVFYFCLGFVTEYLAENHHGKVNSIFSKSPQIFLRATGGEIESPDSDDFRRIEKIFNKILSANNLSKDKFSIYLISSNVENAFAAPGGHIFVLRGFLDNIDSENELAFVLSHELAHHENKDTTKGIGRNLGLLLISTILTGSDSSLSNYISGFINLAKSSYSQSQEIAADKLGLEYLNKTYSHVAGAKDFFKRMSKKESGMVKYLAFKTHPLSDKRVKLIDKEINNKSYKVLNKKEWSE